MALVSSEKLHLSPERKIRSTIKFHVSIIAITTTEKKNSSQVIITTIVVMMIIIAVNININYNIVLSLRIVNINS
jgi:hypothetical protein